MIKNGSYYKNEDDPLEFSVAEVNDSKYLEEILKFKGDVNIANQEGTIFHIIILSDTEKVLDYLLDNFS